MQLQRPPDSDRHPFAWRTSIPSAIGGRPYTRSGSDRRGSETASSTRSAFSSAQRSTSLTGITRNLPRRTIRSWGWTYFLKLVKPIPSAAAASVGVSANEERRRPADPQESGSPAPGRRPTRDVAGRPVTAGPDDRFAASCSSRLPPQLGHPSPDPRRHPPDRALNNLLGGGGGRTEVDAPLYVVAGPPPRPHDRLQAPLGLRRQLDLVDDQALVAANREVGPVKARVAVQRSPPASPRRSACR